MNVMSNPTELTANLNAALAQFNGYFNLFPLYGIVECLNKFDLDASKVAENLKADVGRMNVSVSNDIWLCATWYRMESGRVEVVVYASTNHCETPKPYTTVWTAKERSSKANKLNGGLHALRSYYASKGLYLADVEALLVQYGFDSQALQDFSMERGEGNNKVDVGNGCILCVSWYQMPSGNYEMVGYVTCQKMEKSK